MGRNAGWKYESARHSLAARGIPTGRRYNYVPTYVAGDLPLIAGDAVGVAGAEAVSLIPAVVPVAMLYGGAKLVKRQMEKGKKKRKAKKRKYDAGKKVDDVQSYIRREAGSNGEKHDFMHEVSEQIRHPIRDMDGDWKSMVTASGHKYRKENGIDLVEDRAAATVGKVLSQANIEPLVDKNEAQRPAREVSIDVLFGRRAYNALRIRSGYAPGSVTLKTVNKLRLVPKKKVKEQPVPSKSELEDVRVGDRVAVLAEGIGRNKTFPFPNKVWLRVSSKKRDKLVGRIEQSGGFVTFLPYKKVGFKTGNIVDVQKSLVDRQAISRNKALHPGLMRRHKKYMFGIDSAVNVADNVLVKEENEVNFD